mmetsp:Transcript_15945/g.18503  ORF Transcript_15945/g.18503 Transcript_15945/m.18503 type:complete len:93 (+) Transcript_15945:293-571(+)
MSTDASLDTDKFMSSLTHLFKMGDHSDLTIRINNKDEFNVHKCVLAARSPKLKAMLMSNMTEAINNVLVINRETCEFSDLFKQMLSWIYTEK